MDRAEPDRAAAGKPKAAPRDDVQALQALVALDERVAKSEAAAGQADLPARRKAILDRIPPEAVEIYEEALRRGLLPPAVATRGRVCWGCFHHLSSTVAVGLGEETFQCCPHCERLLFNPDWTRRR